MLFRPIQSSQSEDVQQKEESDVHTLLICVMIQHEHKLETRTQQI